jgi:hypothetical protein
MTTFTVYFENGFIHTQEVDTPLKAAILAQEKLIRHGIYFAISSIENNENGKVYKIKQEVIEVKDD